MDKFIRKGNDFYIKKKDHFYYVIMNDLDNLKESYNKNKYILCQKDNSLRNLLHWAAIANNYEIAKFLLEKGINFDDPDKFLGTALYYSQNEIRNLLIYYGASIETYNFSKKPKGIFINIKDKDKINYIYKDLLNKDLVYKISFLKEKEEIIGKRLLRKAYNSYNTYNQHLEISYDKDLAMKQIAKKWIKVYHGTRFVSIEHILIYGLRNFGEPLKSHIPLGTRIFNIDNWSSAVFVSPSIFYASKYSELIESDNQEWLIIIEALIDDHSFTKHNSTLYNYNYLYNEPKEVEYRIEAKKIYGLFHSNMYDLNNIKTISLLFVKRSYLESKKSYLDGLVFKEIN